VPLIKETTMLRAAAATLLLFAATSLPAASIQCENVHTFGFFEGDVLDDFGSVTSDASANATAIWERTDGIQYKIYVADHAATRTEWNSISPIGGGLNAIFPSIASNAAGDTFATWVEKDELYYHVRTLRRPAGPPAWERTAANLTLLTTGQDSTLPRVAVDRRGNAFVVWLRTIGGDQIAQVARYYAVFDGWSAPFNLSAPGSKAFNAQIGVTVNGDAHAVWNRSDGTQQVIQTSGWFPSNEEWSNPVTLGEGTQPQVATSAIGDATFVWTGPSNTIRTSRYSRTAFFWSHEAVIGNGGGPQVAVSPGGDAVAVWIGTADTIQMSRYSYATNSWSAPVDVLTGLDGLSREPAVAIDSFGVPFIVWSQYKSGYRVIYAVRYPTASGPPDESAIGLGTAPQVAVDAAGTATIVWRTAACNLSAGCPPALRTQGMRCAGLSCARRRAAR
jgi:hypothetical protein